MSEIAYVDINREQAYHCLETASLIVKTVHSSTSDDTLISVFISLFRSVSLHFNTQCH
jgi:hypothetical protein